MPCRIFGTMSSQRAFLWGGLALLVAVVFSTGFHHWDEHFQILEFAGWKLGITPEADLPWEFAAQLRPALQPMLVVWLCGFLDLFGTADPFILTFILRLFSASLTFVGTVLLVRGQLKSNSILADPVFLRWYLFLSYFLWFTVYNGVRFSSEGLSCALFLVGYALFFSTAERSNTRLLLVGVFFGLAFVVRYQTGLMIAGLVAWAFLVQRIPVRNLLPLVLGVLAMTGLGIAVDRWFYGTWTITLWTYFEQNLIEGKAAAFGTEPWWAYFSEVFLRAVPPFSVLFLLPPIVVLLFRRKDPLTWTVLPFLLVHLWIGHKEIRFLFPLLGLLPLLIITGLSTVRERWWPALTGHPFIGHAAWLFGLVHVLMLAVVMLKPADSENALYRTVYREFPAPITLLHEGEHPYYRVAAIHFYRRPGLHIARFDPAGTLPQEPFLFVSRADDPPELGMDVSLVYTSFPAWVRRFNIGGWVERSDRWSVWLVEP
jgi:GPI mannosyltransferase 3